MSKKLTAREYSKLPWMHVYPQYFPHSEAMIRGNREALEALRDALNDAINTGEAEASVFASDGEGYGVKIYRTNTHRALGQPEYIYELEFDVMKKAVERDRRINRR